MSNRREGKTIELRKNVPWRIYDLINRRDCIHFDAWILDHDGVLYFRLQKRIGGRVLDGTVMYRAEPWGVVLVDHTKLDLTQMRERKIGTQWAKANAPWLDKLHRDHIQPMLHEPLPEAKGYRSIRLHYVFHNRFVPDPLDGIRNYYGETKRAAMHGRTDPTPVNPWDGREDEAKPRSPWSAKQRAILRTLDKVIKGKG